MIVIGSGPGRRLAGAPPGADRQAHPDAGARRLPAALARATGIPRPCSSTAAYQATDTWYGNDGRDLPSRPALLRRRQLQSLWRRAVPPARADFGELRHNDGISPAWPLGYDVFEPYYTRGRGAVPRARPARRGPDRTLVQRALRLSAGPARAAHPGAERHPGSARGCIRSICRSASSSIRTRTAAPPPTAPASAATRSTAFPARSTPRPTPR